MTLKFVQLVGSDLAALDLQGGSRDVREGDLVLAITPLRRLNWLVLNVFAPWDHALHWLRVHRDFADALHSSVQSMVGNSDVRTAFELDLADHGVTRESVHARILGGTFARAVGAYFGAKHATPIEYRLAWRHASISIPEASFERVRAYFQTQLDQFAERSFARADESVALVVDDDIANRLDHQVLNHVDMRAAPQGKLRSIRLGEIRRKLHEVLNDSCARASFLGELHPATRAAADVNFFDQFPEFVNGGEAREILSLRARLLVAIDWPSFYSSVSRAMARQPWEVGPATEITNELESWLRAVRRRYPVLSHNPLA